ncbi:MAG: hypothetical protein AAGE59_20375 [Cyanobacteria bacterium P01_F01_bin.86]
MYYQDRSYYRVGSSADPLQYVFPEVRYVGWLGGDEPYQKGNVVSALAEKLREILFLDIRNNTDTQETASCNEFPSIHVHLGYTRGRPDPCPFCKAVITVKPDNLQHYVGTQNKVLGRNQFCLPSGDGTFYVAPTLIYHYIIEHWYQPPQLFLDVLDAFDLGTPFNINTARAHLTCLQVPTHLVDQLHQQPIPQGRYLSC